MNTYYIKQKIVSSRDNYLIYDKNKQPILQAVGHALTGDFDRFFGSFFSIGYKLHINNLDGEEQFILKKKLGFIWQNYDIVLNNNVCASIHRDKNWWNLRFSISGEYGNYTLDGDIFARDYTIVKDTRTVATIKKKCLSFKDTYELCVYEDDKYELFIATVIAIDNSCHN